MNLLKIIKIFCLVSTLLSSLISQVDISIGLNAGITKTLDDDKLHLNHEKNYLPLYGFNVSVFSEIALYKFLNLFAEFGYNQKGFKPIVNQNAPANEPQVIDALPFNTLTSSVGIKGVWNFKIVSPFILFGYRLDVPLDKTHYVVNEYNPELQGVTVGVGVETYALMSRQLTIDIEYKPDLTVHDRLHEAFYRTVELKLGIELWSSKKRNQLL